MPNSDEERTELALSKNQIIILAVFYLICFLLGSFSFTSSILFPSIFTDGNNIILLSCTGAIGSALLGSSIYYIRKLYKSLINGNLKTEQENSEKLIMGTFLYFFARPFISIGLALLLILAMLSSSYIMFTTKVELSSGFQYLAMFISFFGGFSVGNFITKLENKGANLANKILRED